MGFGYTRKQQKCTFLRCLQSKFQPFISALAGIVGRSTFGNVAGSALISMAVACTVCGALSKMAMLMCMVIRILLNLGRNLLILYAQEYTFGEIRPRQYAPWYALGLVSLQTADKIHRFSVIHHGFLRRLCRRRCLDVGIPQFFPNDAA